MTMNTDTPKRVTKSDRQAAVATLRRIGNGGMPAGPMVNALAEQLGVARQTLYRWLREATEDGSLPSRASEVTGRFEVDVQMLTVLGHEQSRRDAYEKLKDAGVIGVGYSTFCRAVDRADPALVEGALGSRKGLAGNRLYLKNVAPHRCYRYHVDHTEMDLWVLPSHRHTHPIRPHLTVITDAYSGYVWAFPWYKKPDGQMIAAALATTCVETTVAGFSVGGVPHQAVWDNAGEHFASGLREACARMGIVVAPTSAYSSWQNGTAERSIQLVNNAISKTAPGAIHVKGDRGSGRFLANVRAETPPENLWTAAAFEMALEQTVRDINQKMRREARGGLTRLELFASDPTDRVFLTPSEAPFVALSAEQETFRASKAGIQFRKRHYICPEIAPGRKYQVRHLPGRTDFIEVFDTDGRHVGRAHHQETLTKAQRDAILTQRARVERDVKAMEEGIRQHRVHLAALGNEAADGFEPYIVFDDVVPGRDPEAQPIPKRPRLAAVKSEDPDAVADADAEVNREQAAAFSQTDQGRQTLDWIAAINDQIDKDRNGPQEVSNNDR